MVDPSSASRRGSTSSSAAAALRDAGFDCSSVESVAEQGWASWTYVVDGRFIARFPRNDQIAERAKLEMRVLPALARHVSYRVPEPVVRGEDWFAYELIPGRPLRRDDDIDAAFAAIDELHTFPLADAQRLLRCPTWEERLAADWAAFEALVFPLLDPSAIGRLAEVEQPPWSGPRTFVHGDLGPMHLLVDDESGRLVGIIDFESAGIGDPAMDRLPTTALADRPITLSMWAYRVRGTLHALRYYVEQGLDDEVPGAMATLRRRLDARPRR